MTPEEKKASRRARRAKIGQDLFATQAERPFLFPPKFTFVFRAFTTIDGIGKALDARYDLARISQPYLKELADLKDGSAFKTAAKELAEQLVQKALHPVWRQRPICLPGPSEGPGRSRTAQSATPRSPKACRGRGRAPQAARNWSVWLPCTP